MAANTKGSPPLSPYPSGRSILALGFFGRSNTGDEAYSKLLPVLFPGCRVMCFDDIASISDVEQGGQYVDTLVCGGGDILNPYFMNKLTRLIANHKPKGRLPLRIYGLSVGIPFAGGARRYLALFDHLFVRSRHDYELVANEVGESHVTLVPDMAFLLPRARAMLPAPLLRRATNTPVEKIAICLAQPMLFNNPRADALMAKLATVIRRLLIDAFPRGTVQLLAFNTSDPVINPQESDHAAIGAFWWALDESTRAKCTVQQAPTVEAMQRALAASDVVIGSRFHSVIFSALEGVPCVALYCQQKIHNFVSECDMEGVRMLVDHDTYKPTDFDENELFAKVVRAASTGRALCMQDPHKVRDTYAAATDFIRKNRGIPADMCPPDSSVAAARERCLAYLSRAFGKHTAQAMLSPGRFSWGALTHTEVEQAVRIICYGITDAPDTPYFWGLYDKVMASRESGFDISDSVAWIASDFQTKAVPWTLLPEPRSQVRDISVRVKLSVDPFYQRWLIPGSNQHREGWQNVVAQLRAASDTEGTTPDLVVDTFVDRTFHWGEAAFLACGVLPYRTPWVGFIHHTFNETHSTFNCAELLRKQSFIASLVSCKGLFVLSEALASELRAKLPSEFSHIPVIAMKHPVHFSGTATWTPRAFMDNPDKKLVQIGSWLRRPFSIYRLQMRCKDDLKVRKCALRGRAMDKYFMPEGLHDAIRRVAARSGATAAPSVNELNKYVEGALNMLQEMEAGVTSLDYMDNADYDTLLSRNVVFLDLEDASACNAVLECMASTTPLIVNRLPALEEVLGNEYPGFYTTLDEAGEIATDMHRVMAMHAYLSRLDKREHTMAHFLASFGSHAHRIAGL